MYAEQIGVVQHHRDHREGPQTLDVRPEFGRPGRALAIGSARRGIRGSRPGAPYEGAVVLTRSIVQ